MPGDWDWDRLRRRKEMREASRLRRQNDPVIHWLDEHDPQRYAVQTALLVITLAILTGIVVGFVLGVRALLGMIWL